MKKLAFFSSLLVMALFVLVSCSKDDPRPASGNEISSFGWTFSNVSITSPNASLTLNGNTLQLADILSTANKDKVKYLLKAEMQYDSSNITISGLSQGQILKNVTVLTSDKAITSLDLGTVTGTGSSIKFVDNTTLTFLNNVCNSLYKNKSITLNATISTGDQTVSGVSIVITLNAKLSW